MIKLSGTKNNKRQKSTSKNCSIMAAPFLEKQRVPRLCRPGPVSRVPRLPATDHMDETLNLYESVRSKPSFNKLEIGDLLFAEYTGPVGTAKLAEWSHSDCMTLNTSRGGPANCR